MPVKFTKHALQRIKTRNISKDDILDTLDKPNSIKRDSHGNLIAQRWIDKYLLRVFYYIEGNAKIVITAYRTLKGDKYL